MFFQVLAGIVLTTGGLAAVGMGLDLIIAVLNEVQR